MKIALLGYGKMGKEIEKIALSRGHQIVLKKSSSENYNGLENADVAIDFSLPNTAVENITTCFNQNIPVISGTTGWLENYDEVVNLCNLKNGALLYASNFSVGVNIFFELNNHLAKLMAKLNDYKVSMEEIHHTQKLDAPSGTAISLANQIIDQTKYTNWTLENSKENEIKIDAKRIENIPGTHFVTYTSEVDEIQIKHEAFSRQGFALGAVVAAEWILNKKGIYSMKDVLNLG